MEAINHSASVILGDIALGKAFFLRLQNAFLLANKGDIIEVLSDFDNLESELTSWAHFNGEKFLYKKPLKNTYSYYLQKTSQTKFLKPISNIEDIAPLEVGLAPRGVSCEIGVPHYHFEISAKENVWTQNVTKLYEEAKSAQWNATNDIAWSEVAHFNPAYERAVAQIMTYLIENEFSALYIPSYFLNRISPFFTEVPLFLSSVIGDEARHIEVFFKRAKATGLGLQHSTITTQQSLYTLFREKDYVKSSFLLHIMGEGTFIDLLAFLEKYAKDSPTKRIFNLARLDESRHVAYGMTHIKTALKANPHKITLLKNAVFSRKDYLDELSTESTLLLESLAIYAGGDDSANAYKRGLELVDELKKKMQINRTQRLVACGIDEELANEMSKAHTPNFM